MSHVSSNSLMLMDFFVSSFLVARPSECHRDFIRHVARKPTKYRKYAVRTSTAFVWKHSEYKTVNDACYCSFILWILFQSMKDESTDKIGIILLTDTKTYSICLHDLLHDWAITC